MNKYILFRNQYANKLVNKIGVEVCNNEADLQCKCTELQDGDIIIVDAHYKGSMSNFEGMKIVSNLQSNWFKGKNVKYKILSWFEDSDKRLEAPKENLYSKKAVAFVPLPVMDIDKLKI